MEPLDPIASFWKVEQSGAQQQEEPLATNGEVSGFQRPS